MLNRTITLISATVSILVVLGTFFSLYIAFDYGVSKTALLQSTGFLTFVFFIIMMIIGAILTILSSSKKSGNFLVAATIVLIISGIPAAMYNLSNGVSSNPYLLSIMSAPSIFINILQLLFMRFGVTNYESELKIFKKKK